MEYIYFNVLMLFIQLRLFWIGTLRHRETILIYRRADFDIQRNVAPRLADYLQILDHQAPIWRALDLTVWTRDQLFRFRPWMLIE